MQKLKLSLDTLAVESFDTSLQAGTRGTVDARGTTDPYNDSQDGFCPSNPGTCVGCPRPTFGASCNGHTECGTCYDPTCDLQEGCGGTSYDMQIC